MAGLIDDAFSVSLDKFWAALDAADKAVSDANWNEMLARTAPTPDVFARCACGSEYTAVDNTIELSDEDLDAAADALAARFGQRGSDSVVYAHQARAMIQAINQHRERIALNAESDWHADHEICEIEL
jgi:hypothetical protein